LVKEEFQDELEGTVEALVEEVDWKWLSLDVNPADSSFFTVNQSPFTSFPAQSGIQSDQRSPALP